MMSLSICIATLNRHDVLMVALTHVLKQTRLPMEVIVVDASDDWKDGKARAAEIFALHPEVLLDYRTSPIRSSATQRNLAINIARGEIVFMIDDDSFLHEDCLENLLALYAADEAEEIVGIGALLVDENPAVGTIRTQDSVGRKDTGRVSLEQWAQKVLQTRLGRWFNKQILFQSAEMLFIRYDEPRLRPVPASVADQNVTTSTFMPGSGMSVRRKIALQEPFDTSLRYYAAFEDLDVAYRFSQHGAVLRAPDVRLHHFEAAAGRIKRKKVIAFQILNMGIFLKRHAKNADSFLVRYRIMMWRRLLAEFLKDVLSRRWQLPQVAGVLTAMRHWRAVWNGDVDRIDEWYPDIQRKILEDIG